jgi:cobalamin biosynthesis Mg chelatase CobN
MILSHRKILLLSVGVAAALVCSGTAIAAPSGDEYLPKVPDATGNHTAGGAGGDFSSGTSESTQETQAGDSSTAGTQAEKKQPKQEKQEKKKSKDDKVANAAAGSNGGSSGGDGSSGLLIGLLIVAVVVVAGGMILRHRAGLGDDEHEQGGANGPEPGGTPSARPTPDGEIVTGREKI